MDLEPGNPMILHLVPRLGKDTLTPLAFRLTPGFTIHSVCAFERAADSQGKRALELYTTAWESEAVAEGRVKGGLLGSWEGAGEYYTRRTGLQCYCTCACAPHIHNPFFQTTYCDASTPTRQLTCA